MKLTIIQSASSRPISASKRMFENHHTSVPSTIVIAVNVTALPDVLTASRTEKSMSPDFWNSSMIRLTM